MASDWSNVSGLGESGNEGYMSDHIEVLEAEVERLTQERDDYRSVRDLARDDVYRLRAEAERLRALVKSAFYEGYDAGEKSLVELYPGSTAWRYSDTRIVLAGEGNEHE